MEKRLHNIHRNQRTKSTSTECCGHFLQRKNLGSVAPRSSGLQRSETDLVQQMCSGTFTILWLVNYLKWLRWCSGPLRWQSNFTDPCAWFRCRTHAWLHPQITKKEYASICNVNPTKRSDVPALWVTFLSSRRDMSRGAGTNRSRTCACSFL